MKYISSDTKHHELENDYAIHVCIKKIHTLLRKKT